jgi:hypothetical protein
MKATPRLTKDNSPHANREYVKQQIAPRKLTWLAKKLGIANASKLELYGSEKMLGKIQVILDDLAESRAAIILIDTASDLGESEVENSIAKNKVILPSNSLNSEWFNDSDSVEPDEAEHGDTPSNPYDRIPLELHGLKQWVTFKLVPHPTKSGKFRKLPFYTDGSPRRGKQGSPEDRASLSTLGVVRAAVGAGLADGVGIAILPGCGYVALDFDNCVDDAGIAPKVLELVAGTYHELSPSGSGVRAFFRGTMPSKKNVDEGIEVFGDSGFVTVTGLRLSATSDIADLDSEARRKIEAWVGARPEREAVSKPPVNPEPIDKIKSALDSLPVSAAIDRDTWFKVCCALHDCFDGGDNGFALFDSWSRKAGTVYGGTRETWDSLKGRDDGITLGTLYKVASDAGWRWSQQDTQATQPTTKDDFVNFMEGLTLTQEEADAIANPEWIIKNLVIQGHLIVIPAKPNGGKTTIFFHLAGEMVAQGFRVFYVNADISGGDAKSMRAEAAEMGVTLALPDMKGSSMNEVVKKLEGLNFSGEDLGKFVFIFDTLKKMTEVIDKSKAKKLYGLLRSLTAKGATVILLAHTNKYCDGDGMPIFEGTGDLRADVDELIYLIPVKHPDESMTVSTLPDKVRGAFGPITFKISADRKVMRAAEHVDTLMETVVARMRAMDQDTIDVITLAITTGVTCKTKIIAYCKDCDIGKRQADTVLKRYTGKLWRATRGAKNTFDYALID